MAIVTSASKRRRRRRGGEAGLEKVEAGEEFSSSSSFPPRAALESTDAACQATAPPQSWETRVTVLPVEPERYTAAARASAARAPTSKAASTLDEDGRNFGEAAFSLPEGLPLRLYPRMSSAATS